MISDTTRDNLMTAVKAGGVIEIGNIMTHDNVGRLLQVATFVVAIIKIWYERSKPPVSEKEVENEIKNVTDGSCECKASEKAGGGK